LKTDTDVIFTPVQVVEINLDQPIHDFISASSEHSLARFLVLVRLHSSPIGILHITCQEPILRSNVLKEEIQRHLGEAIKDHLTADGISEPGLIEDLHTESNQIPGCLAFRQQMLEAGPFVSVIIATRDRTSQLAKALDSVLAQAYPQFEIIVVDNAPVTSETYDLIHTNYSSHTHVKYLREDRPGLASAHNTGIAYASGEILAFTDDDLRTDKYWLASLVSAFQQTDHVGCVTGLIMPAELVTFAQMLFEQYSRFNKGFAMQVYDLGAHSRNNPLYPYSAGIYGSGANMAFSRKALDAIGGFDTCLGAGTSARGGDDLAAFLDVVLAGFRLIYEPAALVWHMHRREYSTLRKQIYGYGVGLTAYLTRTMIRYPRHALKMIARIPYALQHTFSGASPKNRIKPHNYPKELDTLERMGMLFGPIAYSASWWNARPYK
jgi:GT2 family glycosyltransferase